MRYLLTISDNLRGDELEAVRDYWALEQGMFIHRAVDLAQAHNLTVPGLTQLASSHSTCQLSLGYCSGCGDEVLDLVRTRSDLKARQGAGSLPRCPACWRAYEKRQLFEERVAAGQVGSALGPNAVELRPWEILPADELDVLRAIVQLKFKSLIYAYLLRDGYHTEKTFWPLVNSLIKKNLLLLEHDYDTKRVVMGFHYPTVLEEVFSSCLLDGKPDLTPVDFFGVKLQVNLDKSAQYEATYTGVFTLQRDVLLRRGQCYAYGGWVAKKDGSINLQLTPFERLVQEMPSGPFIESQVISAMVSRTETVSEPQAG